LSDNERIAKLLIVLERMAGGEHRLRAPISQAHDEIDAVAHAVNVLSGELDYALQNLHGAKEQAESANRSKTLFLRNLSHEIRTPLSAILGIVELLLAPDAAAERREELTRRIRSNGLQLKALIDDLLDLSSIEAGALAIEPRRVLAREALADVVSNLQPEAQLHGREIKVQASEPVDDAVLADGKRVRQILANLLAHALGRSGRGETRVVLARAGRNEDLTIDVIDAGPRRSVEQALVLFEPFTGADAFLGLALARRLARAMGGDVTLVDGALRLSLPPVPEPREPSEPPAIPAGAAAQGLKERRILLAEDDDDIREATAMLLQIHGAVVHAVCDGIEVVERASSELYHVILMDIRMPRLNGLAATRRLRDLGIRVPIIALTADAVADHREECLSAGCDAHLAKPLELERLVAVIRNVTGEPRSPA
jgi:signal transduction histidine kinase/ActR/RegA family two-component response regulator